MIATRVHINPTLDDYNQKKAELKLVKELNTEISKEYKERFPFMNWSDIITFIIPFPIITSKIDIQ